ncbi:histidine kinase [Echinicola strongylocentroti]|uniref:histidine kinase n=1 Tax=Echinicola strongylocentroti TaxID=1795355 RepID=A0A2Z4IFB0_9BACT|nr:ATP-binding protein [Echinicola strongylocentroti]AWW29781.1 histidine kinase [Echinicola strongylocentroti]
MKSTETTHKARKKVVIGFMLAIMLVLSVGAVTYFSLNRLLDTVETLSEPSDRMQELNSLLADVYQLDKVKGNFEAESDTSVAVNYLDKIEKKLNLLEQYANDTVELNHLKQINYNINELVVVYNGLREVKHNLINRNFSREALKNLETKIKRQEEINRLQSLGKIRFDHKIRRANRRLDTSNQKKTDVEANYKDGNLMSEAEMENLRDMFQQFRPEIDTEDTISQSSTSYSDSVLYAVKQFLININYEEQHLRSNLAQLEKELNEKNRALIEDTQTVISNLQYDALAEVEQKNESLYDLAFDVAILLGVIIFVGIVGSSAFIYSILTEINKDENYRFELEQAKLRSDKLAKAKQNFLANMSHEIRNPLHAIQGYNEAIRKTSLDKDQTDYVNMVGFAAETLSGIVNDILDLSKLEAGKITIQNMPFNPHKLFKAIKNSFELRAKEKQIDFAWDIALPKNKWFSGDELRIRQILNNLISNALKFTEDGSVAVSIVHESDYLLVEVKDTGIGMTEEFKDNIFKEFNQGDGSINRRYGGTGLGLAIVKRMLDLLKGKIELESNVGEGTTFSVRIPVEQVEAPVKAQEASNWFSLNGLRVLLVDDDAVGLKFAKLLLESNGAKVYDYLGGVSMRDDFDKVPLDLAVLDVQMPEVTGYDALRLLKNNYGYADLPTIAITANVFAKEKDELSDAGFDAIVLKPFKEFDLVKKIGELLDLETIPHDENGAIETSTQGFPSKRDYAVDDIEKFCMGEEAMLKEVLIDFCSSTSNDLIEMDHYCDDENWEQLLEVAHKLGSRLGQLKIKSSVLARGLEYDLKEGNTSNASVMVEKIKKETLVVLDQILIDYQLFTKVS